MLQMYFILASVLIAVVGSTHLANDGPCPDITFPDSLPPPQSSQRKWNILYHDVGDALHLYKDLKCVERHINYDVNDASVVIDSYGICDLTNRPVHHRCYGYGTETPGVFKMIIQNGSLPFDSLEIRVVDTDRKTYAVGYACGYNSKTNTHAMSACISSTTLHLPSPNLLQRSITLFRKFGLSHNFIPVDWTDCRARCDL